MLLGGKAFAGAVVVSPVATVLSVVTAFGITDKRIYEPLYGQVIVLIVVAFAVSVIPAMLLVRRMVN